MKSSIKNISGEPLALSSPYKGILGANKKVTVPGSVAEVIANLGGAKAIKGILRVKESTAEIDALYVEQYPVQPGPQGPAGPSGPPSVGTVTAQEFIAGPDKVVGTEDDVVSEVPNAIYVELPAGETGREDCVCFYDNNAPFRFRILDDMLRIDTPQAGSVVSGCCVMDAGQVTDVFDGSVAGIQRSGAFVGDRIIEEGGSLMVHRSNDKISGAMTLFIQRI